MDITFFPGKIDFYLNQETVLDFLYAHGDKPKAHKGLEVKVKKLSALAAHRFIDKNVKDRKILARYLKENESRYSLLDYVTQNIPATVAKELNNNRERRDLLLNRGNEIPNQYRALKHSFLQTREKNFEGLEVNIYNLKEKVIDRFVKKLTTKAIKSLIADHEKSPEELANIYNQFSKKYFKYKKEESENKIIDMNIFFENAQNIHNYINDTNNNSPEEILEMQNKAKKILDISYLDYDISEDVEKILNKEDIPYLDEYNALKYIYLTPNSLVNLKKTLIVSKQAASLFVQKLKSLAIKSIRKEGYKQTPEILKKVYDNFVEDFNIHKNYRLKETRESTYEHFFSCQKILEYIYDEHHNEKETESLLKKVDQFIDMSEINENKITHTKKSLASFKNPASKHEAYENVNKIFNIKKFLIKEKYVQELPRAYSLIMENTYDLLSMSKIPTNKEEAEHNLESIFKIKEKIDNSNSLAKYLSKQHIRMEDKIEKNSYTDLIEEISSAISTNMKYIPHTNS